MRYLNAIQDSLHFLTLSVKDTEKEENTCLMLQLICGVGETGARPNVYQPINVYAINIVTTYLGLINFLLSGRGTFGHIRYTFGYQNTIL